MRLDVDTTQFKSLFEEKDPFPPVSKEDMEKRGLNIKGNKKPDDILYTDRGDPIKLWDIQEAEIIYYNDLLDDEKQEFDYDSAEEGSYFRHTGDIYSMGDFLKVEQGGPFDRAGWHGIQSMGYWGGVIIALNDSGDGVKVAMATW